MSHSSSYEPRRPREWVVILAALAALTPVVYLTLPRAVAMPAVAEIPATPAQRPQPGVVLIGHVDEVIDGDTLDVSITYSIRVRLLDCWSPETRGAERDAGIAAKAHMIRMAADRDCIVQVPMRTNVGESISLGRLLGRVWIAGDELDLSTRQVMAGHATRTKTKGDK